ncbi:MAG: DNA translocase FtsK [Gallionella sp.]|nr:DNA translocase FtsK [Gallionella sp.]MDD4947379.1 DNA translocase FtsK [Gallionella sp.]
MTYPGREDPLFSAVKQMVIETNSSSIVRIQRKFLIGHERAAAMVAALVDDGITVQNALDRHFMQRRNISDVPIESQQPLHIKVLGIGGCGINMINYMLAKGTQGIEFVALSSDEKELARCKADQRLQLSTTQAMPTGNAIVTTPEEDCARIKTAMAGADMVFVVAGMGGNTGTSVAPIAAQIARNLGIQTIAVVSMPFAYEGNRMRRAPLGIKDLFAQTDALVIIPLEAQVNKYDMFVSEVFEATNLLMHFAVVGIAKSLSEASLVSLDIADLRTLIAGIVTVGTGEATGPDRGKVACEQAIASIASTVDFANSSSILVNVAASSSLKLREIAEIIESVELIAKDAVIVAAAAYDDAMKNSLRVTMYCTGPTSPFDVMAASHYRTITLAPQFHL